MNKDTFYPIEIKICSKNGWFTPQEALGYYGRYNRTGITVHWWGDGTDASNHDNIVNYFLGQANAGIKSVNYVLSDNKITLMVSPDNVAWCQESGNATDISIEHQPTLGAEGYKKSGWLVNQLEERYGRKLILHPHSYWFPTSCPGSIDLNRIRSEADKWAAGVYTQSPPTPTPKPVPSTPPPPAPNINISYSVLPAPVKYVVNKDTDLWNFNTASWAGFVSVKKLKKGEDFIVYAIADNHNVHSQYGVTQYSFNKRVTNGVNMKDLDLSPTVPVPPQFPAPTPVPTPIPTPPPGTPGAPAPIPTFEERVSRLEKLYDAIKAALAKIGINL